MDCGNVLPHQANKVPVSCAGTCTAWATSYLYAVEKMGGRGVAIGSDVNGAAAMPGPRFGTYAAYGTHGDSHRLPQHRLGLSDILRRLRQQNCAAQAHDLAFIELHAGG